MKYFFIVLSLIACGAPQNPEVPDVATIGIVSCDAYLRTAALCVADKTETERDNLKQNIKEKELAWLKLAERGGESLHLLENVCDGSLLYLKDNWNCE